MKAVPVLNCVLEFSGARLSSLVLTSGSDLCTSKYKSEQLSLDELSSLMSSKERNSEKERGVVQYGVVLKSYLHWRSLWVSVPALQTETCSTDVSPC